MIYALIDDGLVTELATVRDPNKAPWYPCGPAVQVGWKFDGHTFAPVRTTATPTAATPLQVFIGQVSAALTDSDKTMGRIQEAVSLGLTTWTTADVVAWVSYRRNLRALMPATFPGTLPTKPTYPVGT